MQRYLCVFVAAAIWLSCAAGAAAQSGLGSITGTAIDQTGGRLPGADIKVVEKATGATRAAVSNEAGLFNVPALPPGTYTVTVSLTSFKTKQFDNLALSSFQQLSLGTVTLELSIGPTDAVEVTATAPMLDIDSGVRHETIDATQVRDMPLQGRNWASLIKVVPGSNPTNESAINGREYSANGFSDFAINGKNPRQTQVNLDGGSIVDHGTDGKTSVAPSLESIQEIAVLTNNFQAEYGNRGGTVINVVTKSGTNQLRGALFDYARNEALNAGKWEDNFNGKPKTKYRFNYAGANLGGPIRRNKLFFFYNFENFQQKPAPALITGRVPTEAERRGDFSQTVNPDGTRPTIFMPGSQASGTPVQIADRIIPQNLITPLGRALMNAFPLPNNPGNLNENFVYLPELSNPRRSNTIKVDWNINERSQANVRYTDDAGTQIQRTTANTSGVFPGANIALPHPDRALSGNYTRTFTQNLVVNSTVAWSYDNIGWAAITPDAISKSKLGLSGLPTIYPVSDDLLPQVTIPTFTNASWAFNRVPAHAIANEYQASATMSWARGTHFVKGGMQHITNTKDEIDGSVTKGFYDFTANSSSAFDTGYAAANVLVGAVSRYQQIERLNRKYSMYRDFHAFLQDTWKPTRTLTLDYGLRLSHMPTEYNTRPDETLDAVFLPSRWDPAKAPRFYVPDPRNPSLIIDPANPGAPLPAAVANALRYTIVPGSGDLLNGVVALGKNGEQAAGLRNPPAMLAAPRGGFAWTLDDRTVLRGGFGWSFNRNTIQQAVNRFENGLGESTTLVQTSLSTLAGTGTLRPIQARSIGARDEYSDGKLPTVYDYSLSAQQQLTRTMVLDVAYIGNRQTNQPVDFNLNAIPLGTAFKPEFIDPRVAGSNFAGPVSATNPGALPGSNTMDPVVMRPFRGFDQLMMTANIARVNYNSLQVNLSQSLRRFNFQVSYTLGRAKGQIENGPALYLNTDWEAYTGYKLNTDRLHVLNVNYVYETPAVAERLGMNNVIARGIFDDWKIAHLLTVFSGQDYSPTLTLQQARTTTNFNATQLNQIFLGTPDITPRPVLLQDPNDMDRDLQHQFNAAALGLPGIYPASTGTGERNFLRGMPSFGNDLSFVKIFPIQQGRMVEVRANFYNVFNNVRRSTVNSNITYKAKGATLADGFDIINTPEANEVRSQASGVTDPLQLYNQYRSGVGHVNVTTVSPMRIVEIGLALRF
jgi:hypothetical protein